jgi:uncharacterized protein YdhG (YjbR/CyaY superfamily)
MTITKNTFESIDAYIATFPPETQKILEQLRDIVKTAAPEAREKISYHMPALDQNGNLVLFAAWKKHIGFYGTSHAILEQLKAEVSPYTTEKGTLQFPYSQPLPAELITKIVKMRITENLTNAK